MVEGIQGPLMFTNNFFSIKCLLYTHKKNEIQDQTLKTTGGRYANRVFFKGQLYVACSRVSSKND